MNKITFIAAAAAAVALSAGTAFAQTSVYGSSGTSVGVSSPGGTNVGASVTVQARITAAKSHADQELDRRISMLTDLNARVQAMTKVSANEKNSISSTVSTEITDLTVLKAKIDADTDLAALRTDIKSIAQSYRIFVLVVPRGRIDVAADKVSTVASAMTAFAGKLQARVSAGGSATASLSATLADMNSKIADAQTQANTAVSAVADLQPDNGDKTVEASNAAALKTARADIRAALADLKAARQDAGTIVRALESANAGASSGASGSTQ